MKHSTMQELRRLSDDEVFAVSGGKGGKDPGSPKNPTLPQPPPNTGSTAGLYLFPLIYKMN